MFNNKPGEMPGMTKSFYNEKQGKWYLTAQDAAKWKPGPCVVWEMMGQCPKGAKCTCAHLDRAALNDKNQRNSIGNYIECTMPARCKYVLKEIKGGQWAHMKGLIRAEAPCLVELLEWLPAQPGGEIDVDVVQSFITANKTVAVASAGGGAKPQISEMTEEEEREAQNFLDEMLIECEEVEAEAFARTPAWAPNGDVPTEENVVAWEFENFQQEEDEVKMREQAFLIACEILAGMNQWVYLQMVNAQLEWLRAEEQRLKAATKPERNWAALVGGGAVKAPTVAPAVKGEVVVLDDENDDYEWKNMSEEKLM